MIIELARNRTVSHYHDEIPDAEARPMQGYSTTLISKLESDNKRLRAIFPKILEAINSGACSTDASIEFMELIPNEVRSLVDEKTKMRSVLTELLNTPTNCNCGLSDAELQAWSNARDILSNVQAHLPATAPKEVA